MRNYKIGSRSLGHEPRATVPGLSWLGLKSGDVLACSSPSARVINPPRSPIPPSPESLCENSSPSDWTACCPEPGSFPQPAEAFSPLTEDDRCKAINILHDLMRDGYLSTDELDIIYELHVMLMLNLKAEIQIVDDVGCIADWLDSRLSDRAIGAHDKYGMDLGMAMDV